MRLGVLACGSAYGVVAVVAYYPRVPLGIAAHALYAAALAANLALFRGWGYRLLRRNE